MAAAPPDFIDVTDIQFKLFNKYQLFNTDPLQFDNCNLLAAASTYGLVIVASLTPPQLKVIKLDNIVDSKGSNVIPARSIPLPNAPTTIALSCDHSLLAVNFIQNGFSFLNIYLVTSFLAANITIVFENIRISPEDNVKATQLLWNPVISNTLAVCLDNGSLSVYNIKGQSYQINSIDKTEQARCASWSPKGKQIVVAFPNGKLAQYKPDLTLAKTIPCTAKIYAEGFDVIAVQWLSTFQFAAIFLQRANRVCPALHIINAPKNASPTYTNYEDICFGQSGPRKAQVFLTHILPWNLLLVASANSMEIGVLGTTETGETPTWKQYYLMDEARAELPLTIDKQESFPVGLVLETGCTHKLTVGENEIPIMPMIHLLSTHGALVSFNIINKRTNSLSICSPPNAISDISGLYHFKIEDVAATNKKTDAIAVTKPIEPSAPVNDTSFGLPTGATSTPTAQKPKSFFGTNESLQVTTSLFGNTNVAAKPTASLFSGSAPTTLFGGQTTVNTSAFSFVQKSTEPSSQLPAFSNIGQNNSAFGNQPAALSMFGPQSKAVFGNMLPNTQPATINSTTQAKISSQSINIIQQKPIQQNEQSKSFITVAPTYQYPSNVAKSQPLVRPTETKTVEINEGDNNYVICIMIADEINLFEKLFQSFLQRAKDIDINIATKEATINVRKQLNELQDISNQATESTEALTSEIQSLKLSLNEAFTMATESKNKHMLYSKPNYYELQNKNQTCRRHIAKLQNRLAINENQFQIICKHINVSWSTHEDNLKQTKNAKMQIPSLENVYQTLSKQREILYRLKSKINFIKTKLGLRETANTSNKHDISVHLLTNSIVSMRLCNQINAQPKQLLTEKVKTLREVLKNRNITVITPKRPSRKGLNSEVVVEKKLAYAKPKLSDKNSIRAPAVAKAETKTKADTIPTIQSKPVEKLEMKKSKEKIILVKTIKTPSTVNVSSTTNKNVILNESKTPFVLIGEKKSESGVPAFTTPKSAFSFANIHQNENIVSTALATATQTKSSFSFSGDAAKVLFNDNKKDTKTTQAISSSLVFGMKPPETTASIAFGAPKSMSIFSGATASPIPFASKTTEKSYVEKPIVITPKPVEPQNIILPKPISSHSIEKPKSLDKENSSSEIPKSIFVQPVTISQMTKPLDLVSTPKTQSILGQITNISNLTTSSAPSSLFQQNNSIQSLPNITATAISTGLTFSGQHITDNLITKPETVTITLKPTGPLVVPANVTVSSISPSGSVAVPSVATSTTTTSNTAFATPLPGFANKVESSAAVTTFSFASLATTTAASTTGHTTLSKDNTELLLQDLSFCKPSTTTNATSPNVGNLFSMSSFSTPKTETIGSIFGAPGVSSPSNPPFGIFSSAAASLPPVATSTTVSSPFTAFVSTNLAKSTAEQNTSMFSLMSKPEASVFSSQISNNSPFGGAANTAVGFATSTSPANSFDQSIFGGSAVQQQQPAVPFGGSSQNLFGAPKTDPSLPFGAQTTPFGQNSASTGVAATNIFSQSAAATGGSIFGGTSAFSGNNTAASGGSIFGGGSMATGGFGQATTGAPAFAPTSPFGQQNSSTFGSLGGLFIQGGPSIAQSGFGAPNNFGAQQTFGTTAPAFSAAPAFGAAPTFGSPKGGFGTFANVSPSPATNAQKSTLFESLGASETEMTFGNIAQNTDANDAMPAFTGGSSFSTWR